MSDDKLNVFFKSHKKLYEGGVPQALVDNIMAIPEREFDNKMSFMSSELIKVSVSKFITFLIPRISGLAAACILGLYFGGLDQSLTADEMNYLDTEYAEVMISDALNGIDDFSDND